MSKKWYVVHAYSGFEKSVARNLQERIKRSHMEDQFGQIRAAAPVRRRTRRRSASVSNGLRR